MKMGKAEMIRGFGYDIELTYIKREG